MDAEKKKVYDEQRKLGGELFVKGEYPQALECFEKALECNVADYKLHFTIAGVHFIMEAWELCVESCERAVHLGYAAKLQAPVMASYFERMGRAYEKLGNIRRALQTWALCLQMKDQVELREHAAAITVRFNEMAVTLNEGLTLLAKGDSEGSRGKLDKGLQLAEALGDKPSQVEAHNSICTLLSKTEKYAEALAAADRAMAILDTHVDAQLLPLVAKTHGNRGNVLKNLGRLDEAREAHEQHLLIATGRKDNLGRGAALSNLGTLHVVAGRLGEAVKAYAEVRTIAEEMKDAAGVASVCEKLARVKHSMGNYGEAESDALAGLKSYAATDIAPQVIAELGHRLYARAVDAVAAKAEKERALGIALHEVVFTAKGEDAKNADVGEDECAKLVAKLRAFTAGTSRRAFVVHALGTAPHATVWCVDAAGEVTMREARVEDEAENVMGVKGAEALRALVCGEESGAEAVIVVRAMSALAGKGLGEACGADVHTDLPMAK